MKVKSPVESLRRKEVVYRIPSLDCETVYIGETGRTLQKRLVEHRYAVKKGDRKNGIAVHAWDKEHRIYWEGAEVIGIEPPLFIWIYKSKNNTNLDYGVTIHQLWLPYIS